jgi:hypothetical protein
VVFVECYQYTFCVVPLFEILKEFYQCIIFEIVQADFCILNIAAVCYIDPLTVSVFLEKLHFLYVLINIYGLPLLQMFQYCGAVQIFINHPKASDRSIYPAEPGRLIRRRPPYSAQ